MGNDALQIVVTILGLLSQLVVLLREMNKREDTTSDAPAGGKPTPPPSLPPESRRAHNFLDLGFVLLCSAFFSLLLTDSLVISGRAPSPGLLTTAAVFAITVTVCGVMFTAWRLGRSELVTGFLALITLCVLIISPGGPFGSPLVAKDVEQGLTLYLPVLSLVTLASVMLIYAFGNPLSNTLPRKTRLFVGQTLLIVLVVSAIALGQHLVRSVMSKENAPKIDTADAIGVLRDVGRWDAVHRRQFYQLASEIALAHAYQAGYQDVRGVRSRLAGDQASTPGTSSTPPRRVSSEYSMTPAGSERLQVLDEQFHDMPLASQEKFLIDRLDWIHTVGNQGTQVTQPLTGLTARSRADGIGEVRLEQLLSDRLPLYLTLKEEFPGEYPTTLTQKLEPPNLPNQPGPNLSAVVRELVAARNSSTQFVLFPALDAADYGSRLRMQLSLPIKTEDFLAFDEYVQLAMMLVKSKNNNPQDNARYQQIADDFGKLPDASQNALWFYVANDRAPLDVLGSLVKLSAAGVDFAALTDTNTSSVYTLKAYLDHDVNTTSPLTPPPADDALKTLAYNILVKTDRDTAGTVQRLLDRDERSVPVRQLFQPPVLALARQISELTEHTRKEFIDAIADPVWPAVQQMARTISGGMNGSGANGGGGANGGTNGAANAGTNAGTNAGSMFGPALNTFRNKLSRAEQENVLHQMAIGIYLPGGAYSLDPMSLLVLQARSFSDTAALICAAAFVLPLLVICVLAGAYGSRKLVARDRMRELVAKELQTRTDASVTAATPVALYGRTDVLTNLRKLAERGWSTIGVVGRRGVGKSRILHALTQPVPGEQDSEADASTVKVWVASPSRFQEDDFIASIFERLAMSTESAIANFLGAQPLAIRQIENRSSRANLWYYSAALSVLLITMYQMYDRLTRSDIVITWVPIATLLFVSLLLVAYYASTLQPLDLSSWLQRDRAHNPHTVMLYREVNEALIFLRERARRVTDVDGKRQAASSVRGFLMKSVLLCGIISLFYSLPSSTEGPSILGLAITAGFGALFMSLYRQREDARGVRHGDSIMSLVAEYRAFAGNIVNRLNRGALGHSPQRKFAVLVCIDELDKIVDFEEIRGFVRRIKAIFEVPGVYYYVSLAEDTLTALYLGAATGKNEIDSAFDHVVRIPPVTCDEGENIAARYLQDHGAPDAHPRLARTIATVSYGIPRDIIRRCDEYLARTDAATTGHPARLAKPADSVIDQRQAQAALGYELRQLSSAQVTELSQDPTNAAAAAERASIDSAAHADPEAQQRLIMALWLLALIEAAIEVPDDQQWRRISDMLCTTGYKMPVERVADVRREILRAQSIIWPAPAMVAG